MVQQDGDGSELDCPQRQAGNSHWRAFSYSGTRTPLIRLPRNAGHTGRMDDANHTQPLAAELSGQDRATFIRGRTYPSTEPIVSSGEVAHPSRCTNLATSMTTLECDPTPISLAPSVARTANSFCRPSTLVTSASPH